MKVKQAQRSQEHVAGETVYWFDNTQPFLPSSKQHRVEVHVDDKSAEPNMVERESLKCLSVQAKNKKQMHLQPFRRVWVCLPRG